MNRLQIIIPERMAGERLDLALAEMLPELSRSKITNCIKSGHALISLKPFKPKDKVIGNEIVDLTIIKNGNNNWHAEDIPINVIYEDEDIIVINKQAGVVTHPGPGNWGGTLANALLNYDPELKSLDRAGIVHRLDKNTSGLMVVARNQKAQKYLVGQLQNHSVTREYSAIVYGHMISGGNYKQSTWKRYKG
jgi:23S rRNA pseudouridine1911/1915/1917 synthase